MVINVFYGTENKKEYIVKTQSNKGKAYYSEPMTRKQAKQVAKKLSRMFQVPIKRIK